MSDTKRIDQVLSRAVEAGDVPGVVAMAASDNGVVYEGAFGKRELGKDAAMTPDTVVWIASMTKAIAAAAAMQLVERGKLSHRSSSLIRPGFLSNQTGPALSAGTVRGPRLMPLLLGPT